MFWYVFCGQDVSGPFTSRSEAEDEAYGLRCSGLQCTIMGPIWSLL